MPLSFRSYSEATGTDCPKQRHSRKPERTWTFTTLLSIDGRGPTLAMPATVMRRQTTLSNQEPSHEPTLGSAIAPSGLQPCHHRAAPACLIGSPPFTLYREFDHWWTTVAAYLILLELVKVHYANSSDIHCFIGHVSATVRSTQFRSIDAGKRIALFFNGVLIYMSVGDSWSTPHFWAVSFPMLLAPNKWFLSTALMPH